VILTVAVWIAALTPALADTGPVGAPVPDPNPAADDPVRIGIGIGGELIDVLSHEEDGDDDDGDEDNGDDDGDNGDEDNGDDGLVGVVHRVLDVLVGEEDDSAGSPPARLPVAADPVMAVAPPAEAGVLLTGPPFRPADDDDGLVWELLGLDDDGDDDGLLDDLVELDDLDIDIEVEPVEDVVDILDDVVETVTDAVDAVICAVVRRIDDTPPPGPPAPPQQPCI
jgi:hypothetical protein